ncbi:hypothetical protein N7495_001113 [Penicillium taxi]|uniref:uncharacterized protein n=1 Tax=Penicillium taxi TaxID=168475 RepID=UPI002544E8BD|nr:uncharacterized protein N7495_001113 [Penicillium taxi]KAJ5908431.1 hypothetical protein N7495_001113 [Penicillium taxi]
MIPSEIRHLQQNLKNNAARNDAINHMVQFCNKKCYMLGHVFCGSGLQRTCSRKDQRSMILDWALIDIRKRGASPQLFDYGRGVQSGKIERIHSWFLGSLQQFKISEVQDPSDESKQNRVLTWEQCIVSPPAKLFAEPGDSGSLVWQIDGRFAGILHAGGVRSDTCYITLIEDVF